ncbi:MAG: SDR family oxidoreductase [Chitinivibrionales bacterium]|nr:SDR family oxidoreductase [Chitinivibrionales bacterium]
MKTNVLFVELKGLTNNGHEIKYNRVRRGYYFYETGRKRQNPPVLEIASCSDAIFILWFFIHINRECGGLMDFTQFSCKKKKALVTGGNTGIGLGIAKGLARAGAVVAIAGRDEEKNRKALAELKEIEERCVAFQVDLEETEKIAGFYKKASAEMMGFDILVNNAGMHCRGRADKILLDDFNQILAVNLTAPFVLSQCFAREKIENVKPGTIIMICSLQSEAARPTTAPYAATKGGLKQLVKACAVDWAEFDIRVNGIGPGYIQTEMTQSLYEDPEFDEWVVKRTPLRRWGEPDDFEGAAVFLASDASRFVTGQVLYVDGGWLATF